MRARHRLSKLVLRREIRWAGTGIGADAQAHALAAQPAL
jgi:hypothetical protein